MALNKAVIDRDVKKALERVNPKNIGDSLKGVVITAFERLTRGTPQWSGQMAANTTIFVDGSPVGAGGATMSDPPLKGSSGARESVYHKGMNPAVALAHDRNRNINNVKITDLSKEFSVGYTNVQDYYSSVAEGKTSEGKDIRDVNKPFQNVTTVAEFIKSQTTGRGSRWTRGQFAGKKL